MKKFIIPIVLVFMLSGCINLSGYAPRIVDIDNAQQKVDDATPGTPEHAKAVEELNKLVNAKDRNEDAIGFVESVGNGLVPYGGTLASLAFALYMASGKGKIKKALVSTVKVIAEKGTDELKAQLKVAHTEEHVRPLIDDIRKEV